MKEVSIIIPVYNEEESIRELYEGIMDLKLEDMELIFIDDGSTDSTLKQLKKLKDVKIIQMKENIGKSHALTEGFKLAQGKKIMMLDGDLQDDPKDIPKFLARLDDVEFVIGWRKYRKDSKSKVFVSKVIYNRLNKIFFGLDLHDANCGMKAMKSHCKPYAMLGSGMHRYLPFIMFANGFFIDECIVTHHKRKYGKSKYGLSRLAKGFIDMLVMALYLKRFSIGSWNVKEITNGK